MASVTDLNSKRSELNTAISAYAQTIEDFKNATATQADVDAAKTAAIARGDEYAKLAGQVKKDNPSLPDADFFSNPSLMTATIREKVADIMTTGLASDPLYLYDDFTGENLNADRWDRIPGGIDLVNIAGGVCTFVSSQEIPLSGIISRQKFPVGTTYKARVKNPGGRHGVLIGISNAPTKVGGHSNPEPAICWYSRGTLSQVTIGSYRDENGTTGLDDYSDFSHTTFSTVEMRRVSSTRIEFYLNGTLKYVADGPLFADDYKVYFGIDGYDSDSRLDIDWVEVIGPTT